MTEFELLLPAIISQIESCTLSNHKKEAKYIKITIRPNTNQSNADKKLFFIESFTQKQAFQKSLTKEDTLKLLLLETGIHYKNVSITTSSESITILTNKKGKQTILRKSRKDVQPIMSSILQNPSYSCCNAVSNHNKKKHYLLEEGVPVAFLIELGIMNSEGKIIHSKYNKFKQINRYLEFIDDIIDNVIIPESKPNSNDKILEIVDFGCGKSYLTFALYHYITKLKGLKAHITGLDLKKEVIEQCSFLAKKFDYDGLQFSTGDIASYSKDNPNAKDPDMVITLHACDTATDFALAYAVQHNAKIILSVPCCQHELNSNLSKHAPDNAFDSMLKYGIVKERFSALATDVMRAEILEQKNYSVQLLEFIDIGHTPKNILIRGVLRKTLEKSNNIEEKIKKTTTDYNNLCNGLGQKNTLAQLLHT